LLWVSYGVIGVMDFGLKALSTLTTVVAGNGDNLSPNWATAAENGDNRRIRRL